MSVRSMSLVSLASKAATANTATATITSSTTAGVVRIPSKIWRQAALNHQQKVKELLLPALLSDDDYKSLQQQQRRQKNNIKKKQQREQQENNDNSNYNKGSSPSSSNQSLYHQQDGNGDDDEGWFRPLDPQNPVCNFLIEYYGLKGHKGTKRLARWSPSPNLLLRPSSASSTTTGTSFTTLEEFEEASKGNPLLTIAGDGATTTTIASQSVESAGIFLEDVTEDDFETLLHLRGAILESGGALYSPARWFDTKIQESQEPQQQQQPTSTTTAPKAPPRKHPASPFLWFRSILKQTLQAEPIMHCHGLHEWAMQYRPGNEPEPPSAKYQNHLKLRVDQDVINTAVERKGISCTHVDALRFFAPAAGPLNHHGSSLAREDQLRMEQPACVHAHMDLLKIGLRVQPFCDAGLIRRVLQISMDARRLDVAASPYDATEYGVGVVPIETKEGRAQYRQEQRILMERAEPIRRELLQAYDVLLKLAFDEDPMVLESQVTPSTERYATAEPGGKPWRQNLMASPSS